MADSEDDVPPLEDMSEMLKHLDNIKEQKSPNSPSLITNGSGTKPSYEPKLEQKITSDAQCNNDKSSERLQTKKKDSSQTKTQTFGGMKKGFLFGEPSKPKATQTKTQQDKSKDSVSDEIPLIKPKAKQHELPEVQEAMKMSQGVFEKTDWVTEDLLGKVQQNETLMKRMADPTFMQALAEFQTNPTAAKVKYSSNPEIQKFFLEFSGILGDHFTKLGDNQSELESATGQGSADGIATQLPSSGAEMSVRSSTDPKQPTAQDEKRMQEILSKPDVKNVLMDPQIQKLMELLRNDPHKAQSMLMSQDASLQKKIKVLIDVGLLQIQR